MVRQPVLEQPTDFSAILAVAIAHREEVAVLQTHDVGRCYVGILVRLVGVVSGNTSFSSKRKLGYNIVNFIFGLCRLRRSTLVLSVGLASRRWLLALFLRLVMMDLLGVDLLLVSQLLRVSLHSLGPLASLTKSAERVALHPCLIAHVRSQARILTK